MYRALLTRHHCFFRFYTPNEEWGLGYIKVPVGPAKREGKSTTIFDHDLRPTNINTDPDGEIHISFCAGGMYDNKSAYRYTLIFSRSELDALVGLLGTGNQPANV